MFVTFCPFYRLLSIRTQQTTIMRQDNQLLVITHLSQLATLLTGFGGLLIPLILWATQKEKVYNMDEQGKRIVNFQLSLIIYAIICVPLILLLGLGILGFIVIGIISIVFPVINAIRASNGETPDYPMSIQFIR
jgi:uncharacterized Tic20 family protein